MYEYCAGGSLHELLADPSIEIHNIRSNTGVLFANLTPIQAAFAVAKEDRHFQIPSNTRPALAELISFGIDGLPQHHQTFPAPSHNCLVAVGLSRFLTIHLAGEKLMLQF